MGAEPLLCQQGRFLQGTRSMMEPSVLTFSTETQLSGCLLQRNYLTLKKPLKIYISDLIC